MTIHSTTSALGLASRTEERRVRESADREAAQRGQLGQFFTPAPVAALLAGMFDVPTGWLRLLDPGAGVGSLTAALVERACNEDWPVTLELTAVEVDEDLLPPLKDAHRISLVKPFTRVLANGVPDGSSATSANFPTLLVRRYGQGVTGLVNGDGLWKWDFYPEARELGNMYEDFWIQLIQWMASYSEFLPGQDFSLRLPALKGNSGEPVTVSMSFRGTETPPAPVLKITSPAGKTTELQPAAFPDPGGHPNWRASFTPDSPGPWKLTIADPRENAPPVPEATFTVPAPLAESDNLSADPAFLASLAESTGGSLVEPDALGKFLETAFTPVPPTAASSGAIWQSSWLKWPLALLIAIPLALEWYLRRRQGLS